MAGKTKATAATRKHSDKAAPPGRNESKHSAPRESASASASVPRQKSSAKRGWGWEALPGIIGEKCFQSDDFTHTEVARWWYDMMASGEQKYRWKAGSRENASDNPSDAREAVLSALAQA